MATTKGKLGEQIKRLHKAGMPSHPGLKDEEYFELIGQVVNQLLKVEHFSMDLGNGESIPPGSVMAHYSEIAVEQWKNRSRIELPAMPVRLPRNLGVFRIAPTDDPTAQYIPIPAGQSGFIAKIKVMNELLGQVGYEVLGNYAVFTRDLTSEDIESVDVDLIVMDVSSLGAYDMLPIAPDMELQVITEVLKLIGIEPVPDKVIDPGSEPSKIKG